MSSEDGNSVTDVDAATGQLVRAINGAQYGFHWRAGIAVVGTRIWVADSNSNSLTEVDAATGKIVKVLVG
jgi:DNA-binding beta-propeller fold protein YncE